MQKVFEFSIQTQAGETRPATAVECEALADHNWQNFTESERVFTSTSGLDYDFLFVKFDEDGENGLHTVHLSEIE